MEITLKHGKVIGPNYLILGTKDEFLQANGAAILVWRNGEMYDIPPAIIPTKKYGKTSLEELWHGIILLICEYPDIAYVLGGSLPPKEILEKRIRGEEVSDDGIWPIAEDIYKEDDERYVELSLQGAQIAEFCIVDD